MPKISVSRGFKWWSFEISVRVARDFINLSLDHQDPIITSCGSGITACILTLAADVAGLVSYQSTTAAGLMGSPGKLPVVLI